MADAKPSPEPGTVRSTLKNVKNRHKSKASVIEYSKRAPECATAPASMVAARRKLPAWEARSKVVDLVARHDVVLVAGETGCGEVARRCPSSSSTRRGVRPISRARNRDDCPRSRSPNESPRSEARTAGQTVGYQVRFESSFSDKVVFATPGVLLRKLGSDPDLVSYTHFSSMRSMRKIEIRSFCWWLYENSSRGAGKRDASPETRRRRSS